MNAAQAAGIAGGMGQSVVIETYPADSLDFTCLVAGTTTAEEHTMSTVKAPYTVEINDHLIDLLSLALAAARRAKIVPETYGIADIVRDSAHQIGAILVQELALGFRADHYAVNTSRTVETTAGEGGVEHVQLLRGGA